MKGLIIIPARKNSKRLKKKNIKILNKKPLIQYTINFAKKIKNTSHIIVSTDDIMVKNLAIKNDLICPWLRPKNLSLDKSKSYSFAKHSINWFQKNFFKPDYIILLQPTSPFRSKTTFKKIFSIFKKKKTSISTFKKINLKKNSKNYIVKPTGNIFINSTKNILKYKSFINKQTIKFFTNNKKELIDIDTISDFKIAKKILLIKNKKYKR